MQQIQKSPYLGALHQYHEGHCKFVMVFIFSSAACEIVLWATMLMLSFHLHQD